MEASTRVLIYTCVVLVTWLRHPTSSYVLEIEATLEEATTTTFNVGGPTGDTDDSVFTSCLCNEGTNCETSADPVDEPTSQDYSNVTGDIVSNKNGTSVSYFVCFIYKLINYTVSCEKQSSNIIPCSYDPCSVNIKIACTKDIRNVTLVWILGQQARVYNSYGVVLEDCCHSSPTTTNLKSSTTYSTKTSSNYQKTTTSTTTTSTTIISYSSSTKTTKQSSPQEDTPTLNSTQTSSPQSNTTTIRTTEPPLPSPSDTTTGSNNSAQSVPEKQTGDSSSQFTGLHIGVIIGSIVATAILTIIIMCVIWKFKTASKDSQRNNNKPDTPRPGSTNQTDSSNNVTRTDTNDSNSRQPETATISSPVVSHGGEDKYSRISQAYNYIDIDPTTNLTANTPGYEVPVLHASKQKYILMSQRYRNIRLDPTTNLTANTPGYEVPVLHASKQKYILMSQRYRNIGIDPTTNLTASTPGHEVPAELPRNSNFGTYVETDASETPEVYSHLGESTKPISHYNHWHAESDSDSYSLPNLTVSSPETNHSVDNKSAGQPVYNNTQQQMLAPESGIKEAKPYENIKPTDNYSEIDLTLNE